MALIASGALGCDAKPQPPAERAPSATVPADPAPAPAGDEPVARAAAAGSSLWTNVRSKALGVAAAEHFLAVADPCVREVFERHPSRRSTEVVVERKGKKLIVSTGPDERPFLKRIRGCLEAIPDDRQPEGEWIVEATVVNPR
jgi:hypothetical protein